MSPLLHWLDKNGKLIKHPTATSVKPLLYLHRAECLGVDCMEWQKRFLLTIIWIFWILNAVARVFTSVININHSFGVDSKKISFSIVWNLKLLSRINVKGGFSSKYVQAYALDFPYKPHFLSFETKFPSTNVCSAESKSYDGDCRSETSMAIIIGANYDHVYFEGNLWCSTFHVQYQNNVD